MKYIIRVREDIHGMWHAEVCDPNGVEMFEAISESLAGALLKAGEWIVTSEGM